MVTQAQWKMPDGNGGFYVIHHETAAEMIKYGNTTVKDFLDNLPVMNFSTFMKTLMTKTDAESVREYLRVGRETFFDETGFRWSNYAAKLTTDQKKFGSSSAYFDGSAYLKRSINLGGSNFSVSFWTYSSSATTQQWPCTLYSATDSTGIGFGFNINSGGYARMLWMENGATAYQTSATVTPTYNANTWQHWEIDYRNSDHKVFFFFNGTLLDSTTVSTLASVQSFPLSYIGYNPKATSNGMSGYIDEFYITKSILHTSSFTPPTSPYTFNSNLDVALLHFD